MAFTALVACPCARALAAHATSGTLRQLRLSGTRHLSVLTQYVHFFPGAFFKDNPPDKNTDYFTLWLDYKF
jgi:hypothetical protein